MLVTFKHRYSLPGTSFLNVKFSPVGGEHPKYIKSKLGHSSINVTMDIYGHLMDTINQKAASRLGKTIYEILGG